MIRRGLLALALVASVPLLGGLNASASSTDGPRQGWWTTTNAGAGLNTRPPDVPSGGLLVEGGPTIESPTAYAAIVWDLPAGVSPITLTLKLASGAVTTPGAAPLACLLTSTTFEDADGGPRTEGPAFDCATRVTATSSSGSDGFTFAVEPLAHDGVLGIALVASGPGDRIVLEHIDSSALGTSSSPPGADGPATSRPPPTNGSIEFAPTELSPSGEAAALASIDLAREPEAAQAAISETSGDEVNTSARPPVAVITVIAMLAMALLWTRAGEPLMRSDLRKDPRELDED